MAGLLFFLFRRTERWLHQHIFKVGWLLTRNHQITAVLYGIVFLPGVLLRGATVWLAAGALNARVTRSLQLPQEQAIGQLELNFIRLPADAHPIKRAIIAAAPLATGLVVVWGIAVNAFALETVLGLAAPGQLDDAGRALSTLLAQADFWLWFYLAFTISNTMFPSPTRRWRALPILIILLILAIGGQLLWNSLGLILGLITLINLFAVAVLGAIEAVIERISGHSATFEDGRMITLTRQQALARKEAERRQRQVDRSAPPDKTEAAVTSIYMLKLPIPGPPGQEPVSRNAVTVVDAPDIKAIPPAPNKPPKSSPTSSPPAPPLVIPTRKVEEVDSPPKEKKPDLDIAPLSSKEREASSPPAPPLVIPTRKAEEVDSPPKEKKPDLDIAPLSRGERGTVAPFSRPFVKPPPSADTPDEPDQDLPADTSAPFSRPFAPSDQGKAKSKPVTRPVPKPSDKARSTADVKQEIPDDQELTYEPIEEDGYDDEGRYDDLVVP